jgi:hypothetical protein
VSRPEFTRLIGFALSILPTLPALALAGCGGSEPRDPQQVEAMAVRAEAAADRAEKAQKAAELASATASRRASTIASGVEEPDPVADAPVQRESTTDDQSNANGSVADNSKSGEAGGV